MSKRIMIWIVIGLLLAGAILILSKYLSPKPHITLPLYFNYNPTSIADLKNLPTDGELTINDIKRWDDIVADLIIKNQLRDAEAARIYAAFSIAQRDAAFIAFNLNQKFAGNLNSVSKQVLCLYLPNDCNDLTTLAQKDPLSEKIAELVFLRIAAFKGQENNILKITPIKKGPNYWQGNSPYYGQNVGSWKRWLINSNIKITIPPPYPLDSEQMKQQIKLVTAARNNITDIQKKSIVVWAGGPGTITLAGEWLRIMDQHAFKKNISLRKFLWMRSIISIGLADAIIASYELKYLYWVKRPFMINSELSTVMPTPNNPSYPDIHSAISCAAAAMLTFFFPAQGKPLALLADEAGKTTLWNGVNTVYDHEQGCQLGKSIGHAVINNMR